MSNRGSEDDAPGKTHFPHVVKNPFGLQAQATKNLLAELRKSASIADLDEKDHTTYVPYVFDDEHKMFSESHIWKAQAEYWRRVEEEEQDVMVLVARRMTLSCYKDFFQEDEIFDKGGTKYLYFPSLKNNEWEEEGALFITHIPGDSHGIVHFEVVGQVGNWRINQEYRYCLCNTMGSGGTKRIVNQKIQPDVRIYPHAGNTDHRNRNDLDKACKRKTGIARFIFEIEDGNMNGRVIRSYGYNFLESSRFARSFGVAKIEEGSGGEFGLAVVIWRKDRDNIAVSYAISCGSVDISDTLKQEFEEEKKVLQDVDRANIIQMQDPDAAEGEVDEFDIPNYLPPVDQWSRPENANVENFRNETFGNEPMAVGEERKWKISIPSEDIFYCVSDGNEYITDKAGFDEQEDLEIDLREIVPDLFTNLSSPPTPESPPTSPCRTRIGPPRACKKPKTH